MRLILIALLAIPAFAQCTLVFNPFTSRMECGGSGSGTVTEVQAGTGITVANGTTTPVVSANFSVIPSKAESAGTPAMTGQLTGSFAVDTSASPDRLYFCGADDGTDCTAVIRIGGYAEMLPLAGGTVTGTLTLTGALDASGSSTSKPSKAGTSLPGTCAAGETYIKTDATAANQLYICTSTDTWTAQGGSGGSSLGFAFVQNVNSAISASTTSYSGPAGAATTEAARSFIVPAACTARNLYVRTLGTQNAGGTLVVTLRNSTTTTDTALVVTVAAGAAAGTYSNTSDTPSVSAGDRLVWKIVNNYAGGNSATIGEISMQCN